MKKLIALFVFICLTQMMYADSWTQKASFPGAVRSGAFGVSLNGKGYVGLGRSSYVTGIVCYNDIWEYDPLTNSWAQKASFPGIARCFPFAFSINNSIYVGLGQDSTMIGTLNDCWLFNPTTNQWLQKNSFTLDTLMNRTDVFDGNYGYLLGGTVVYTSYSNNFSKYDPLTDQWTSLVSFPGIPVSNACSFFADNNIYLAGGYNSLNSPITLNTFWEYNLSNGSWTQKANTPGYPRVDAASFTICDKGYLGMGESDSVPNMINDLWMYEASTNTWQLKSSLGGAGRDELISFAIGSKGYMGLGGENGATLFSDFWEYTPDSACPTGITELQVTNCYLQITPNPANDFIKISTSNQQKAHAEKITIADVAGKIIYTSTNTSNEMVIDVKHFAKGVYTVSILDGKKVIVRKFLKE